MGTLYLEAFDNHAFTRLLRYPDLCSQVTGIFVTHELSCVEYFEFAKSDLTDVAFLDYQVES